MEILFFSSFSKRINSTKIPTGSATATITGKLKEACSIENPVIQIKPLSPDTLPGYTYAYIPAFSRYYFVTDWTFNVPLWECQLQEDYLASWKTNIGSTSAYIDRCASESDGNLIDTQYITASNATIQSVAMGTPWDADGCFVLGIIDSTSAVNSQMGGAVTYYVLTPAQCKSLVSYLLSDTFLAAEGFPAQMSITQQMSQEMAKAFVNPMQYIVSCMWFPLSPTLFYQSGQSDVSISVGYWYISPDIAQGKLVTIWNIVAAYQATVPEHPQAAARGAYLNQQPYTRLSILVPPFGIIPLDNMYKNLGSIVTAWIQIDPLTGQGDLIITQDLTASTTNYDNSPVMSESTAMIGVPIQLAQVNTDFFHAGVETVQAGLSVAGGVASAFTLNAGGVISSAKEAVSHVANAIDALAPQVRTHGADGSRCYIDMTARLTAQFLPLVDEDNTELGRPLRKIRTINTLSGFIKCYEVTVDYPCFASEKEIIHDYLLSGFFYE